MDTMPLDIPAEDRRPKDWRSLPRGPRLKIKAPSEAAQLVEELLRRTLRDLDGKRITPADCYFLSLTVKAISDLRIDEVLGERLIDGFERRLEELENRFDASELLK